MYRTCFIHPCAHSIRFVVTGFKLRFVTADCFSIKFIYYSTKQNNTALLGASDIAIY